MPGRRCSATTTRRGRTARRSGPSSSVSGVGTQITTASAAVQIVGSSVVARNPAGEHLRDVRVGEVVDVRAAGVQPVDHRRP